MVKALLETSWKMFKFLYLLFFLVVLLAQVVNGCSRRRRRRCSSRDCSVSSWSRWSGCSYSCGGYGTQYRTRSKTRDEYCGGRCPYDMKESRSCNRHCCPVSCSITSWARWSSCYGCGYSTQTSSRTILKNALCGGKSCPKDLKKTQSCYTGRCCPVACKVGNWGSWASCNAACEKKGTKVRTRSVLTKAQCNGAACPTTRQTQPCSGGCCRRDCILSTWSSWTKCTSGSCRVSSGTQNRGRTIKTAASCGGTCSSLLKQTQRCTPTPISCVVTVWAAWQGCVPLNGRCGQGTRKRIRRVIRPSYCSQPCPSTQQSSSCTHSCCPVDCRVNNWQTWSTCSVTCGQGTITRKRSVSTPPSCGGKTCPVVIENKSCQQYKNKDCVLSAWSTWSTCDNGCGKGKSRKTRTVISKEVCNGRKCSYTQAFKTCYDYRDRRDCKVGQWSSWSKCDQSCSVGTKQRTRSVTVSQRCRGNACPPLKESTQCGIPNNGCQHKCMNGVCSCQPGYQLSGSKQCVAKDCGKINLTYCPPGTKYGSTCLYAKVSCPQSRTIFPTRCSIFCPSTYMVKGVTTVTCTSAGSWSTTANTYCRRINDPPTQIVLSGSSTVAENSPKNTLVGILSSVDPNARDTHSYSLIKGGDGYFVIRGNKLYTFAVLDYETMKNRYDLTIQSTDNGNPSLSMVKTFTILLTDINEVPTNIQLSNSKVGENADVNTIIGSLSTMDQDQKQTYSYLIKDSANGRFKIDGNILKTAQSNKKCLDVGGQYCSLNYEKNQYFTIIVQSTDNGNPPLAVTVPLNITITNINDQPRGLQLSNNKLFENATKGHVIGQFSARDEDNGQILTYSLVDSDNGRFRIHSNTGELYKVSSTNYEKDKTHSITVRVQDNGTPAKQMQKTFVIEVLDVNEPPIAIHLNDNGGQQSFPVDHARIEENSNSNTVVGTLKAIDSDLGQKLHFVLDDDASGVFALSITNCATSTLSVCTTKLMVSGDIDYETSSELNIVVRVADKKGAFKVQSFNISVVDVNERPSNITISGGLVASVPENTKGALIGELVTSDEDSTQTHTYDVTGDMFEVRANKLYLKPNVSLDYEGQNKYDAIIKSTDNGTPPMTSLPQNIVIHVTDRNEAPTSITLRGNEVFENSPPGTIIGKFTIADPDNSHNHPTRQSHRCGVVNSAHFSVAVNGSQNLLKLFSTSLDYEISTSFNISVICTDSGGLDSQAVPFTIRVLDRNEPPGKVTISKNQISENMAPGIVGNLSTRDPDNINDNHKQSFNYSIQNMGTSPFMIDGNALKTTRSLNYETASSWTVVVRSKDNGSPRLHRDEKITINVVDINDAPSAIQLSNYQVKENSQIGTVVGELTTVDEDIGQNHSYRMVASASGRFKIENKKILVGVDNTRCLQEGTTFCSLNYENQASFNVTITTTDDGNPRKTFEQSFTLFLLDVNDQPRDLKLTNQQVKENASLDDVIGSFTARDEDIGQSLSFILLNDDSGRFDVENNGQLVVRKLLNHEAEKQHIISAQVMDNGYPPLKLIRNFTIEVVNVNEAPIAVSFASSSSPSYSILENTTAGSMVTELIAKDSDMNQNLTFQLDDNSQGIFQLVQSTTKCQSLVFNDIKTTCTIKLQLVQPVNYEVSTTHNIMVRVTDDHGLFKVAQLNISVIDCNDAPTNVTLSGGSSAVVNENDVGVFVGELRTSDEDLLQTWNYELVDNPNGLFRIIGARLYLTDGISLDYENQTNHVITVTSTDNGSPPYDVTRSFMIYVADVNERPNKMMLSGTMINENSSPGTVIGNLTVEDPDNTRGRHQRHSCAVIGQNSHMVNVQAMVLVSGVSFDFEQTSVVGITIECADDGRPVLKYQQDFTVIIQDVNESPTNIMVSNLYIPENQPAGSFATLTTVDPDNFRTRHQNFTYVILNTVPFMIRDGDDQLETTRELNYEIRTSWLITIQTTDNGSPSLNLVKNFTVKVQDVNEVPSGISLVPSMVDENSGDGTFIGRLSTTDEDSNQKHRYTLLDNAAGRFKLTNQNEVRVASSNHRCLAHGGKYCALNFEETSVYTLRMRTTDNGVPAKYYVTDVNVTVNDVNDKPRQMTLSNNLVKENATVGTMIGYFNASDEDDGQLLEYYLLINTHSLFHVSKQGLLSVAKKLDHEKQSNVAITVQVMDNGKPTQSLSQVFTIIIQNINEAPINTTFTSTSGQHSFVDNQAIVDENSPSGTIIGTLVSLDQDLGQQLVFNLDDDSDGRFLLRQPPLCENGTNTSIKTRCSCQITVNGHLNYENQSEHMVIVRVTDDHHKYHLSEYQIGILDTNDKPTNITLQGSLSGHVEENANNELIGELVTVDEDVSQSHSYSLKNNTNSRFVVKGNKLYTAHNADLNYEEQRIFDVIVMSTDDGKPPKSVEQHLTIQIDDVNERPTDITLSNLDVRENSQEGTLVGNITVTDPDNLYKIRQNHSCQLLDAAENRFEISCNQLLVKNGELNYESSSYHDIVIKCSDSGQNTSLSVTKSFRVQILDINERPTQILLSNQEIPENEDGDLLVGQLATIDPDNIMEERQTFVYTIENGNEIENSFQIVGRSLKTNRSLDYEARPSWELQLRTTDNYGLSCDQNYTIVVKDKNDQPTDIITNQPLVITENSPAGTTITVFSTIDQDVGQSHAFFINHVTAFNHRNQSSVISTPSKLFSLDVSSGRLIVTSPINFETYTSFELEIQTSDDGYPVFSFNKTFQIDVVDLNERPEAININNTYVPENSSPGFIIGTFTISDPDNVNDIRQFYTCHVVNKHVPFQISQMMLTVSDDVLDFETKPFYDVEVNCTQDGYSNIYINRTFKIFITDMNEAPYDLTLSNTNVEENNNVPYLIATLNAKDYEDDDITFSLINDNGDFYINNTALFATKIFDFESKDNYKLTIMARDDGEPNLNCTKKFDIQIVDMNDNPQNISLNPSSIHENATKGTIVGKLTTFDQDKAQQHVYRLLTYNDIFHLQDNQVILSADALLDYETVPVIKLSIETTDNGTPAFTYTAIDQPIITILDSNDVPSGIITTSVLTVKENTVGSTHIVFNVTDADLGQSHICVVLPSKEDFFEIVNIPDQIVLKVKQGVVLDYERNNTIEITLNCADSGEPVLSINQTFIITIADVNEAPSNTKLNASNKILENVLIGSNLGRLTCDDEDNNQTHTFKVLGEYNTTLKVEKDNTLIVISNKKLNYEQLSSPDINVTIATTDNGTPQLSTISMISFTIMNVNESPDKIYFSSLHQLAINETTSPGSNLTEILCNNPEQWQRIQYRLLSHEDVFMIETINFTSQFNPAVLNSDGKKQSSFEQTKSFLFLRSNLSYNLVTKYDVLIEATDDGEPRNVFNDTVTVYVNKVDPCLAPSITCHEDADCTRVDGRRYNCTCKNGFEGNGINCTGIDDCQPSTKLCDNDVSTTKTETLCQPCLNGGQCSDVHLSFVCTCLAGYNGSRCEHDINECLISNSDHRCSGNTNECLDGVNNFTCVCNRGYTGWLCDQDINDCAVAPCKNYGTCIDSFASFACECSRGFTGLRCDRGPLNSELCLPHQRHVPFTMQGKQNFGSIEVTNKNPEKSEKEKEGAIRNAKDVCFSNSNISTIYLGKSLIETLEKANYSLNERTNAIKLALEDWLLKYVLIFYEYVPGLEVVDYFFNLTDVSVLDVQEKQSNIEVSLIARVKGVAIQPEGFICSLVYLLNNGSSENPETCPTPENLEAFTSITFSYIDYLYPTRCEGAEKYECIDIRRKLDAQTGQNKTPSALPNWAIYLLAAVGVVLLGLVIMFAVCGDRSSKNNMREAMRRQKQYDHVRLPEEDDENYHDVMFRHRISRAMANAGMENPLYGLDEEEHDVAMVPNPLYGTPKPDKRADAFHNPLYESFHREQGLRAQPVSRDDLK